MSNKEVYAIYNDDDILMDAVTKPEQPIITSRKFLLHFGSRIKQWALRLPD
jgi:hypothetical protein